MLFILNVAKSNLQQSFEMSAYTWAIAFVLGVLIFFLGQFKTKTSESKQKVYQMAIAFLVPYTFLTGWLWFYYFTLVLCVPFLVLQLVFTFQLYRINPYNKQLRLFFGFATLTVLTSLFAAYLFGIF